MDERRLIQRVLNEDRFLALEGSLENIRRAASDKILVFHNLAVMFTLIKEDACGFRPLESHPPIGAKSPTYMMLRKGLQPLRLDINAM